MVNLLVVFNDKHKFLVVILLVGRIESMTSL